VDDDAYVALFPLEECIGFGDVVMVRVFITSIFTIAYAR
jgi:hypothetical protein